MKIEGKIVEIFDTQQVSDNFKKRSFVVEYVENPQNTQYTESLLFELIQERCSILDDFSKGQEVEVNFNLKGRKWTTRENETRYFNSLQAWKIEEVGSTSRPSSKSKADVDLDDDDLPF